VEYAPEKKKSTGKNTTRVQPARRREPKRERGAFVGVGFIHKGL